MSHHQWVTVSSSDGRAKMIFHVVNIVSSQNVAHGVVDAEDPSSTYSIHMRGSKLQDDMIDFKSPKNKGQTVLHFPSTGATNVTVGENFDVRFQASLNYLLYSRLTWNPRGSMALCFSTNNLNHSGRLYGVLSQENIKERLLKNETHIVDANDKFPSIKFSIPYDDGVRKFQLFVPSFNCNTQFQSADSLRHTGRVFLDILLKYVDFDSKICSLCLEVEMKRKCKLSRVEELEIKRLHCE
jgi:hypothetical protein